MCWFVMGLMVICVVLYWQHAAFNGKPVKCNHQLFQGKISSWKNLQEKVTFFYMRFLRRPSFTTLNNILAWKIYLRQIVDPFQNIFHTYDKQFRYYNGTHIHGRLTRASPVSAKVWKLSSFYWKGSFFKDKQSIHGRTIFFLAHFLILLAVIAERKC